jgi:glycosyltransferase involved in cell wall biosynthesis
MKQKLKIIQIAHASHSYFLGESNRTIIDIIKNDWFSQVAKQVKKFYPELEVECWNCEKLFKKKVIFKDQGITYKIFPTTFSPMYTLDFSIPMLTELKKEIMENKKKNIKTIIHMHEHHNLHGLLIASLFKKDFIISQHHGGSWPLKHLKQTKKYRPFSLLFLLGQLWEKMVFKNIKYFYALSEDEMAYLKKIAPNSKIRFQTLGIEDEYFKKLDKRASRKKLGLPLDKKILIYLGRINQTKGMKYAIDAMEELKDVELKLIGFSQELEFFRDYTLKKGIKNVELPGGIFGEKKLLYLSAADAFLLASFKEGAPVSIMEALAKNLPVISTNVGGIPLMIKNGKNGILIHPGSSKEIVKAAKEILTWKNKDIKESANKYRWKKIVEETVKDYNSFN